MKLIFSISILLLCTIICSAQTEVKEYHDNGNLKLVQTVVDGKPNGPVKGYFENGNLQHSVNLKTVLVEGKESVLPEGKAIAYFEDGTLQFEGSFVIIGDESVEDGAQKIYFENGNLKESKNFENGEEVGLQLRYFENGSIESSIEKFKGNHLNTEKSFYESGTLRKIANYRNGKLEGISNTYFENGKLKETMEAFDTGTYLWVKKEYNENNELIQQENAFREDSYKNNYPVTQLAYFDNGKISQIKKLTSTISNTGIVESYSEQGVLLATSEIKNNVKHGSEKIYFKTGEVQGIVTYENGEPVASSPKFYKIHVKNDCRRDLIFAINYKNLDGEWGSKGFFELEGSDNIFIAESKTPTIYYMAQDKKGKRKWTGSYNKYVNGDKYGFKKIDFSDEDYGDFTFTLSCD